MAETARRAVCVAATLVPLTRSVARLGIGTEDLTKIDAVIVGTAIVVGLDLWREVRGYHLVMMDDPTLVHHRAGIDRYCAHRLALRKNLMTDLFRHERIRTTKAKAQAIRSEAEHLVTIAKRGAIKADADGQDVHERRLVAKVLTDPEVVRKLFDDIAPRFLERPGGYTRMLKLGPRPGDGAEVVILELVKS